VPVDDFSAYCETHPVPRLFTLHMEPFEDAEYLLGVVGLDSDSIVLYGEQPLVIQLADLDFDSWKFGPAILQGIADEVLKNAAQLNGISANDRQSIAKDDRATLIDRSSKI
jgi:hypothetical protein